MPGNNLLELLALMGDKISSNAYKTESCYLSGSLFKTSDAMSNPVRFIREFPPPPYSLFVSVHHSPIMHVHFLSKVNIASPEKFTSMSNVLKQLIRHLGVMTNLGSLDERLVLASLWETLAASFELSKRLA